VRLLRGRPRPASRRLPRRGRPLQRAPGRISSGATAANPDGSWACACSAAGHATRLGRYAASPSRACWKGLAGTSQPWRGPRLPRPPHHPARSAGPGGGTRRHPGGDFHHRACRDGYLAVVPADREARRAACRGDRPLAHSITFVAQLARTRLHPSFLGSSTVSSLSSVGLRRRVPALGFMPQAQGLASHIGHRSRPGETAGPLALSDSLPFAPPVSGCHAVNVQLNWY
jgi:hypothetical protein